MDGKGPLTTAVNSKIQYQSGIDLVTGGSSSNSGSSSNTVGAGVGSHIELQPSSNDKRPEQTVDAIACDITKVQISETKLPTKCRNCTCDIIKRASSLTTTPAAVVTAVGVGAAASAGIVVPPVTVHTTKTTPTPSPCKSNNNDSTTINNNHNNNDVESIVKNVAMPSAVAVNTNTVAISVASAVASTNVATTIVMPIANTIEPSSPPPSSSSANVYVDETTRPMPVPNTVDQPQQCQQRQQQQQLNPSIPRTYMNRLHQHTTLSNNHYRNLPKTQSLDLADERSDEVGGVLKASTSSELPRFFPNRHLYDQTRPIYPNVPYSPYGSPYGSPRTGRRRAPLRESRRISIEQSGSFLQLNQYKLMDQIGQVSSTTK